MSETVIARTAATCTVSAAPLLAAAGVAVAGLVGVAAAVGRLLSVLSDQAIDLSQPIAADSLASQYVVAARAARDRFLRELPSGTTTAACSRAREALARALAVREAFRSVPVLAAVAEASEGSHIVSALQALDRAKLAYEDCSYREAAREAHRAEERLAWAARLAAKKLGEAQQLLVVQKLRAALPALGYRTQEARAAGRVALRASSEDRVLGVVVTETGKLIVEAAGFDGEACRPAIAALFRKLRDEGIAVKTLATRPHGRREGGPLLQRAGLDPADLVRAVHRLQAQPQVRSRRTSATIREADRRQQLMAWLWDQQQRIGSQP